MVRGDIHLPDSAGDLRNHHLHILMGDRCLGSDGFGNKSRDVTGPGRAKRLAEDRHAAAGMINTLLELLGDSSRVSAGRSLSGPKVPRLPTAAISMERRARLYAGRVGLRALATGSEPEVAEDEARSAYREASLRIPAGDKIQTLPWGAERQAEEKAAWSFVAGLHLEPFTRCGREVWLSHNGGREL